MRNWTIEQHHAAEKKYRQSGKGKIAFAKSHKKYMATKKGKINARKRAKRYYYKNREKQLAKSKVEYAITKGKLEPVYRQRCIVCRFKRGEQYHHPDYDKPLFVFPVCRDCHRVIHKSLKVI
jgi:hypothetical protein